MAVSDRSRGLTVGKRPLALRSRYDIHLAAIPVVFIVAAMMSSIGSLPIHVTMVGASLLGAVVVLDGLFFNPPRVGDSP